MGNRMEQIEITINGYAHNVYLWLFLSYEEIIELLCKDDPSFTGDDYEVVYSIDGEFKQLVDDLDPKEGMVVMVKK